jgi:hypothetical protein
LKWLVVQLKAQTVLAEFSSLDMRFEESKPNNS